MDNLLEEEDIDLNRCIGKLDYNKTIDYNVIKQIFELTNQYIYKQKAFSFNENSTVEHILPKKPGKWGLESKEIEPFVNTIGNFVIIDNELNRDLGNELLTKKINGFKTISGKKVSYYHDKCELNIKLFKLIEEELSSFKHDRDYWNEERIRNRIGFITQEFKNAIDLYLS